MFVGERVYLAVIMLLILDMICFCGVDYDEMQAKTGRIQMFKRQIDGCFEKDIYLSNSITYYYSLSIHASTRVTESLPMTEYPQQL